MIEAVAYVLNLEGMEPLDKLILLGLANHADAEGIAWPSVARLARYSGRGERQVQRTLVHLVAAGRLEVVTEGGGRHTTRYRIVRMSPVSPATPPGDADVTAEVSQLRHPSGDIAMTPEPSVEPSTNHQRDPAEPHVFASRGDGQSCWCLQWPDADVHQVGERRPQPPRFVPPEPVPPEVLERSRQAIAAIRETMKREGVGVLK